MATAKLSPVKFHSDTIFCITHNEQPFTAMKPIVENMGLGWASQTQKLNANKERWGVTMIVIPSENGDQNMLCMPVRKLPAYMNSINPKKVRPELRAKIELYQNESDDALWAYWNEGQAVRPAAHGDTLAPAEQAHLHAIVSAKAGMLPADIQRKVRSEIWTRFNRHFRIARYAQLAPAKMGEAVEYLVGMEVKAQKALPTTAEQAAASALEVYTKNMRTSPPHYRTHGEVKARLRGVQRDLVENANTLLACLDNIDKKVLDAFHNPARRGEIATNTDTVLDHFRRSLLRSKEALENQLNACNDTLSGVIGMARILEDPQASGKAVMYGVQAF